jgi:hypothetical protein
LISFFIPGKPPLLFPAQESSPDACGDLTKVERGRGGARWNDRIDFLEPLFIVDNVLDA